MLTIRLTCPVHTLDKQLLLSENSQISTKTIDTLISSNRQKFYKTYFLSEHGSVKVDLINFLYESNYKVIFADQKNTAKVLSILEEVHLILPILQSLDYFKNYDFYTYKHILRVFALSTLISLNLLTNWKDLFKEFSSGPAHDFGKICVPLDILQKTAPLTKKERYILEHHTVAGYVLLGYYYRDKHNFNAKVARDHHERKNSSGYPRGIKLRDRLVEIVAVSDIYDALISPRPYRPISFDNRSALEEITTMAEKKQLSWKVVQALVALNRKSKPQFSVCKVSQEKRGSPPPKNNYGVIIESENNYFRENYK